MYFDFCKKHLKNSFVFEVFQCLFLRGFDHGNDGFFPQIFGCFTESRHVRCGQMSLEMGFPAQSWEENPGGVIHGGAMASMIDTCSGVLCGALAGRLTPTISLQLNYLRHSLKI